LDSIEEREEAQFQLKEIKNEGFEEAEEQEGETWQGGIYLRQ